MSALGGSWDTELQAACVAVRAAGAAILFYYRHPKLALASEKAGGAGPLTLADLGSNALVVETLAHLFPDDQCLSEEGVDSPARLDADRLWILDPLDGTKEFRAGRAGEFCVLLCLAQRGADGVLQQVVGAVYAPVSETLWFAQRGRGAWKQVGDGEPVRIRVAPPVPLSEGLVMVSRSHRSPQTADLMERLGNPPTSQRGSALKAMAVAEGSATAYLRPSPLWEWDMAGAALVAEEAGATVSDGLGAPLVWNQAYPKCAKGILIAHPELHQRIAPVMKDVVEPLIIDGEIGGRS